MRGGGWVAAGSSSDLHHPRHKIRLSTFHSDASSPLSVFPSYFFSFSVHLSSHRALKTNHKAFWATKYIFNRPFSKKERKSFGNRPTKLSRQAPSCPRGLHFLPGPPLYQKTDLNSAVKTLLLRFFPSTRIPPNSAMKSYYLHASPHPISSYNCLVVSRQGGLHIDQPNSHLISLLTYLLRFINRPIK